MLITRIANYMKQIKRNRYLKQMLHPRDTRRMGNRYGGFEVYEPAVKGKNILVYSFGIGEDLSFSEDIIKYYDASVFGFDPTPKSIKYVENSVLADNERFHFSPFGLSDRNETEVFYLPENDDWVSGSSVITKDKKETGIEVEMRDLGTIMINNGHDHIDILKLDIEGSEFKVMDRLYNDHLSGKQIMERIDQVCVEVHDRYFEDGNDKLRRFLSQMSSFGYQLIHIAEGYEELTFLKTVNQND